VIWAEWSRIRTATENKSPLRITHPCLLPSLLLLKPAGFGGFNLSSHTFSFSRLNYRFVKGVVTVGNVRDGTLGRFASGIGSSVPSISSKGRRGYTGANAAGSLQPRGYQTIRVYSQHIIIHSLDGRVICGGVCRPPRGQGAGVSAHSTIISSQNTSNSNRLAGERGTVGKSRIEVLS